MSCTSGTPLRSQEPWNLSMHKHREVQSPRRTATAERLPQPRRHPAATTTSPSAPRETATTTEKSLYPRTNSVGAIALHNRTSTLSMSCTTDDAATDRYATQECSSVFCGVRPTPKHTLPRREGVMATELTPLHRYDRAASQWWRVLVVVVVLQSRCNRRCVFPYRCTLAR